MSCGSRQSELLGCLRIVRYIRLHGVHRHIEKIRESLVSVLGPADGQVPMTFDQIKDLPYLHACFYEAVRVSSQHA